MRGGARVTLTFALSWYSGIKLDQLATMRAASQIDLAQCEEAIGFRAHKLSCYAVLDTYYPELGEDSVPLVEDDYDVPNVSSKEEVGSSLEEREDDDGAAEAVA